MTPGAHQCLRAYLPWICTSLALGYAAYLHWKLAKAKKNSSRINKDKQSDRVNQVNIDEIDRNNPKKRISYCRCYKSKKFPLCDGAHKVHNQENDDAVGPLNLVWVDDDGGKTGEKNAETSGSGSGTDPDKDMDIKSIDSESPKQSSNGTDSNGEFDQIVKISNNDGGDNGANISDEQLSSLEMIDDNFSINNDNNKDNNNESKK